MNSAGTIQTRTLPWRIRGSYFEVCNCDAPCPCRRHGGRPGQQSQFDTCDFALSWNIRDGYFGEHDLQGLRVALAGQYDNRESGKPWRVILYIDDRALAEQSAALTNIFLGWAGGTALRNFAKAISEVYGVKPARIDLDHTPGRERLHVGESVWAAAARPVEWNESTTCGIPGHDRPGQELVATLMRVDDGPLRWTVSGRCGFSTDFDFCSDPQ